MTEKFNVYAAGTPELRGSEFVIAGDSHIFAMGAAQDYTGALSLAPIDSADGYGYFLMEQWQGARGASYWDALVQHSNGRTVVLAVMGNQHFAYFLLARLPLFDVVDSTDAGHPLYPGALVVPRRMLKALPMLDTRWVRDLGKRCWAAGCRQIVIIGTPPVLEDFEDARESVCNTPFWRERATDLGIDISSFAFTPAPIMKRLWGLLQESLADVANELGARFLPVPKEAVDENGYRKAEFGGPSWNFAHANEAYGRMVLDNIVRTVREDTSKSTAPAVEATPMEHPYKCASDRAFWKRAFSPGWETSILTDGPPLIRRGERVASAGSCFAANIVPFLERAGFEYVRRDVAPSALVDVATDNFNYSRFSAAYGNIYTARQAAQMFKRALGRFRPAEDRWIVADDLIIDPFRPGLRYPASSSREFDLLTAQHLANVLDAVRAADVFVFTLGLTEAWVSTRDGAVFPACPGTIGGTFDPAFHAFRNFSAHEVSRDLEDLIDLIREVQPSIRVVLTVSPVPLVATATGQHVLVATTYSKSVLRVAADEVARVKPDVTYFPAYEIVSGPQAPFDFFEADRREPSAAAISTVMRVFLSQCETGLSEESSDGAASEFDSPRRLEVTPVTGSATNDFTGQMSALIAQAQCEEAAAGL